MPRPRHCCVSSRWLFVLQTLWWLVISLLLLPQSCIALPTTTRTVVFGTESGYDVGGTDPLCFVSNLTSANNRSDSNVIELNNALYDRNTQVKLLTKCFPGTQMEIVALDLGPNRQLFKGQPYTFQLSLSTNTTAILPSTTFQQQQEPSVMVVYLRLLLCDTIKQGFCNPLIDSRQQDSTLQRNETDLSESDQGTNINKSIWSYEQGSTLLGLSSESTTHLFTRWIQWELQPTATTRNSSAVHHANVNISLQLPTNVRSGCYFIIGHAIMAFQDVNNMNTTYRVDVANAIQGNVAQVQDAPLIYTVSDAMKIALGVTIGLFASIALLMFLYILSHRMHPMMLLSQGDFLAAITLACLTQIVASFLFLPVRDIHCKLSGPLVLIPMTFVAASMVGRICRAYRTLSGALRFGRLQTESSKEFVEWGDFFVSFLFCTANTLFGGCTTSSERTSTNRRSSLMQQPQQVLRRTASGRETFNLIALLTIPQIVLQVLASFITGSHLVEVLDDESGSVGHVACSQQGGWATIAGISYGAVVYIIAVLVAWIARTLPSAFNEKEQVFHAASISIVLTFITLALMEIMENPATRPDVTVFLRSALSIGMSATVLFLIVLPKIRRVASGEKVVVSVLLGTPSTLTEAGQRKHSSTTSGSQMLELNVVSAPAASVATPGTPMSNGSSAHFRPDEPLPSSVEMRILNAQIMLRQATEKFIGGRQMSEAEFTNLQSEIATLHEELDQLDIPKD